jgi:hypothetical protein
MCGGPTGTQQQLQTEEANFYATQIDAYNKAYANFSDISGRLNAQFAPIIAKGPNQFGFSDAELATLNSQAIEGTANEYNKAQKALNENEAALGGGNSNENITSGGAASLREELAATGAGVQSHELQGIQQAGYAQGYQEYQNAVNGEEAVAAGWNPNSFSSSANGAAGTANNEANAIAAEQSSVWGSVLGALGGIGGAFAGDFSFGGKKTG